MFGFRVTLLVGLLGLARFSQDPPTQLLLVVREELQPDSAAAYATNESAIARMCDRLRCPHPYLALVPVDGSRGVREVWWLNAFASPQDKERVDRAWARNTRILTQLRPFSDRKQQLRQAVITSIITYRRD